MKDIFHIRMENRRIIWLIVPWKKIPENIPSMVDFQGLSWQKQNTTLNQGKHLQGCVPLPVRTF